MKTKTGWILVGILGLVILFFLPSLLMGRFWQGGYYGGMMGGYGHMFPFAFGWMGLMWLVPLVIFILVVLGVASLISSLTNSGRPKPDAGPSTRTCQNCGKPAQSDWATCPYCGKAL